MAARAGGDAVTRDRVIARALRRSSERNTDRIRDLARVIDPALTGATTTRA